MTHKTHWVAGFLFKKGYVALVNKTHPAWQAGKLNGVGGKIEEGESPREAMKREFLEEAGAEITEWREFALLRVQDGEVHFFVAHETCAIRSMTEEKVDWYAVSEIGTLPMIENIHWLIPLALDAGNKHSVIDYFQIGLEKKNS